MKVFVIIYGVVNFASVFIVIGFIGAGLFSGWLFYFRPLKPAPATVFATQFGLFILWNPPFAKHSRRFAVTLSR